MSTHDDDTDPTGMRALLRGLPDPGPMPDDLVARIQASLGELADGSNERTVADEERVPLRAAAASGTGDVPRGTAAPRRASWLARHGSKLAVAAVVVVGGGAAVQLVGSDMGIVGGSTDSSAGSADSGAESLAGSPESAPRAADGDHGSDSEEKAVLPGRVVVTMSGRSYTADGLAGEVADPGTETPLAPLTAESPGIGPIGTELGVRSCLQALGLPPDGAAEVDLGLVDGDPAAVVVVTSEGERTAYAVRRECSLGNPALIAGPVVLP